MKSSAGYIALSSVQGIFTEISHIPGLKKKFFSKFQSFEIIQNMLSEHNKLNKASVITDVLKVYAHSENKQ